MKKLAAAVLFACATHAHAWDGTTTGPVDQIAVNGDNVMIYQAGVKVMCNKGPEYASINENDKGFKEMMSLLAMSRAMGEPVVLYTTNVGGLCRLGGMKIGGRSGSAVVN